MVSHRFYVDVVASGRILGVGPGSVPRDVESALGSDYLDDEQDWYVRRDYGLIEFTFLRDRSLECGFVIVELHRLLASGLGMVPQPIVERYGELPLRVPADALLADLAAVGCQIRRDERGDPSGIRFVSPETGCLIQLSGDSPGDRSDDGWPAADEVWSISIHPADSGWWRSEYLGDD
jgi:hypothetical protein